MPRRAAVAFICATNASCEPPTASASITATSLADLMIRACSAASTVMELPAADRAWWGLLLAISEQAILVSSVSLPSLIASKVR
jgi:hypothetical protein